MNCTTEEAKKKLCIPLSKTHCIGKLCTADGCMSWGWDVEMNDVSEQLFRCPECGIISPEQNTCHKKIMEAVVLDADKMTGHCMEAGK